MPFIAAPISNDQKSADSSRYQNELCKQYKAGDTCSESADDVWPDNPPDKVSIDLGCTHDANVSKKIFFSKRLIRELLAEFIGTFLIVHLGTGAVMSAIFTDSLVGLFEVASVWIIAVTVAICATASISGAHLNPAVSLAFALVRPSEEFNWRKLLPYSMAQLAGAVGGSAVSLLLYGGSIEAFEDKNSIVRGASSGVGSARAFGEYFA